MTEIAAAVLTIRRPADMTEEGAKDIAKWLRKQAKRFERDHSLYADRFRARYLYSTDESDE